MQDNQIVYFVLLLLKTIQPSENTVKIRIKSSELKICIQSQLAIRKDLADISEMFRDSVNQDQALVSLTIQLFLMEKGRFVSTKKHVDINHIVSFSILKARVTMVGRLIDQKFLKICRFAEQGEQCMRTVCNFYHPAVRNTNLGFHWDQYRKPPLEESQEMMTSTGKIPSMPVRIPVIVRNNLLSRKEFPELSQKLKGSLWIK